VQHGPTKCTTAAPPHRKETTPITPKQSISATPPPPRKTTPKQDPRRSITPGDQPKLQNKESYIKYLNRSGPKNLGSKVIPEGGSVSTYCCVQK
jgi:hypothetical protein